MRLARAAIWLESLHADNPRGFYGPNGVIPKMFWLVFGKSEYGNPFGGYVFFEEEFLPALILSLVFFVLYLAYSKISITVTDKRVYGNTIFRKQVDLPLDSISSIGSTAFDGIGVGTSSGRIGFYFIRNSAKVRDVISQLLLERQSQAPHKSNAMESEKRHGIKDELKEYKELLDEGIITQEEFDAKKKQLLGL